MTRNTINWPRQRIRRGGLRAILTIAVCAACASQARADPDSVLESSSEFTLEACVERVLDVTPGVSAARHEWLAAREAVGRVGSLPDPMLTYGYFIDEVETRVGPQEQKLAFRQTLPWFGKLRLRSEAARADADAAYQRYRRAVAEAVFEATDAYVEYANLRISIDILSRRAALLADLEGVVRARYASGDVPYADLMRAGIERARVSDRLAAAVAGRRPLSARLAAALGLTRAEALPWPDGLPSVRAQAQGGEQAELTRESPELLILGSRIVKAERFRSLARRGYFPDITLGVDYVVTGEAVMPVDESGKDPLSISVSVSLPLWFGKHAADIAEQTEHLASAWNMRRQKENDVASRLEMVIFEMDDASRRVVLYEQEIVPLAEQSLASARAAYGSGAVGFETVVAAEQAFLEFELSLARARADVVVAGARLEELFGSHVASEPPDGEIDMAQKSQSAVGGSHERSE